MQIYPQGQIMPFCSANASRSNFYCFVLCIFRGQLFQKIKLKKLMICKGYFQSFRIT